MKKSAEIEKKAKGKDREKEPGTEQNPVRGFPPFRDGLQSATHTVSWGRNLFSYFSPDMALFGPKVGHEALFDEVCKYHEIDKKAKVLLQTIVKKYQMPQPVQIFIEQDTLTRALGDHELSAEHEELQKFYDAWFVEQSLASRRKK